MAQQLDELSNAVLAQNLVDLVEAARMARKRLEAFADDANAARTHYSARELKRKIWAAFAEFDAADKQDRDDPSR